jgi:hypothetical protein
MGTTTITARLLRGSVPSNPDSHLLLDGVRRYLTLHITMPLEDPLALALNSMRERLSLRF